MKRAEVILVDQNEKWEKVKIALTIIVIFIPVAALISWITKDLHLSMMFGASILLFSTATTIYSYKLLQERFKYIEMQNSKY